MNPFLRTHTLALTPLSPIHIGCGEDFEPTNYIIENGLLYGFDPSLARLTELQRSKLMDVARRGALPSIQRFFLDNAAAFKPHAHVVMPVAKGVAELYAKRIGKAANVEASGNRVFNQLEIERHVFTGPQQQPFIPGTSFKGALRTSWLDELNAGRRPRDVEFKHNGEAKSTTRMETTLLGGDFQTSPLRLLKVADLMPVREPAREVLFAVNRKKRHIVKDGKALESKGIAARKDCVLGGQYRLFQAAVTLPQLGATVGTLDAKHKPATPQRDQLTTTGGFDVKRLARACNTYHQKRLDKELDRHDLINPAWKQSIERLLAPHSELGRKLADGKAFLVRMGRYGSADSKTLTGEGVASIKIMQGKGQQPTFESTTKTVWLAAQYETDQKHLIPFGWAVVEIDPQEDSPSLKQWCEQWTASHAQTHPHLNALRTQLAQQRQAAQRQKQQDHADAAAAAAAQAVLAQAQAAKAAARAQLSAQGQTIEQLRERCEQWFDQLPPKGNFKKIAPDANKAGLYQDADRLVKTAEKSPDWSASDKAALAEMLETWLPKIVAPWDAKEQRKKLRFNALRGGV